MNYFENSNWLHSGKYRIAGLILSIVFVLVALYGIFFKGLNLGIDFTGGFITEFETSQIVQQQKMQTILEKKIDSNFILSSAEQGTRWFVRQPDDSSFSQADKSIDLTDTNLSINSNDIGNVNANTSKSWLIDLTKDAELRKSDIIFTPLDSDYIGSQLGQELIEQGGLAMLTALIFILFYLWARFEWRFALGAILALFHDVIVVIGLFAWTQLEFNLTVMASLLAIIGYSLNDSIIVADKVRELIRIDTKLALSEIINNAICSTLTRTLITSGTTLLTVGSIWWLAGTPLHGFSVALFAGILFGTFSSIFISATFPELVGLDVESYRTKELIDKEGEEESVY